MEKMKDKEQRFTTTTVELRANSDGGTEFIEAYALKFNRESSVLGWFMPFVETIDQRALDNTDMSNVVALFNHDQNMVLGRNTATGQKGKVELEVDGIGLKWRCTPTDTSYARDLMENVRNGVINQCSFAFSIADEEGADEWNWNEERQLYERTVSNIDKLYDVSIVTTPAYPDTEAVVASRSAEKVKELEQKRKKEQTKEEPSEPDKRFFDYLKLLEAWDSRDAIDPDGDPDYDGPEDKKSKRKSKKDDADGGVDEDPGSEADDPNNEDSLDDDEGDEDEEKEDKK
jgi:HK97 family phage prohead protease